MAGNPIPKDATIAVIRSRLRDAKGYLRGVLGNMILCKRQHGGAVVRIGTTGDGLAPHYRVEPEEDYVLASMEEIVGATPEDRARASEHIKTAYFKAYHGASHKQLQWGRRELQYDSWSSRSMSLDQVQHLLGEVRGRVTKTG